MFKYIIFVLIIILILVVIYNIQKNSIKGGVDVNFKSKFPVKIIEKIGAGFFGTIFKVQHAKYKEPLALKFTRYDKPKLAKDLQNFIKYISGLPDAKKALFLEYIDYKIYKCKEKHVPNFEHEYAYHNKPEEYVYPKYCLEILTKYIKGHTLDTEIMNQYNNGIDFKYNGFIIDKIYDINNTMKKGMFCDWDMNLGNFILSGKDKIIKIDHDGVRQAEPKWDQYLYDVSFAIILSEFAGLHYMWYLTQNMINVSNNIDHMKGTGTWENVKKKLLIIFKGDDEIIQMLNNISNSIDFDINELIKIFVNLVWSIYYPADCEMYYHKNVKFYNWKPLLSSKKLKQIMLNVWNVK